MQIAIAHKGIEGEEGMEGGHEEEENAQLVDGGHGWIGVVVEDGVDNVVGGVGTPVDDSEENIDDAKNKVDDDVRQTKGGARQSDVNENADRVDEVCVDVDSRKGLQKRKRREMHLECVLKS